MTDAVAARAVRTECLIEGRFSFCQLQSFMRGMILLANQSWQDRVQEKFSILSEMPTFRMLEIRMMMNLTDRLPHVATRGQKRRFAIGSRLVTVSGKTIRHIVIFDNHPD